MNYRVFQYALPAPPLLEDLNAYLGTQRVASVAQHLVPMAGGGTMLVFVVQTVGTAPALGGAAAAAGAGAKIDYREALSAADFGVFTRLREERKKWAEAEGVPIYTVFSNAQLAAMVGGRVRTLADLAGIEGVGAARVERYGARLLALLAATQTEVAASTPTTPPEAPA